MLSNPCDKCNPKTCQVDCLAFSCYKIQQETAQEIFKKIEIKMGDKSCLWLTDINSLKEKWGVK
jgi:hypothetical protein